MGAIVRTFDLLFNTRLIISPHPEEMHFGGGTRCVKDHSCLSGEIPWLDDSTVTDDIHSGEVMSVENGRVEDPISPATDTGAEGQDTLLPEGVTPTSHASEPLSTISQSGNTSTSADQLSTDVNKVTNGIFAQDHLLPFTFHVSAGPAQDMVKTMITVSTTLHCRTAY
jgi:hypothetical protein